MLGIISGVDAGIHHEPTSAVCRIAVSTSSARRAGVERTRNASPPATAGNSTKEKAFAVTHSSVQFDTSDQKFDIPNEHFWGFTTEDLKVGDEWVLYFPYGSGRTDTRTIKDIKNGLVYLTLQYPNECNRETFVYTPEWGGVEGCSLPRFNISNKISIDPPQRHMPFTVRDGNTVRPLRAGDSWELPYKVYGAGLPIENWIEGKALGWETIQVPAGTFEALKIEAGRVAGGIQPKFFVWYSPEANNFIKFTDPSRPHFDYELQSYK